MMIEAVIFDMDGLMIDSERFHFDCIVALAARYGKRVEEEWFEYTIGMDNIECAEFVMNQTGLHLTTEAYLDELYDIINELLPDNCVPNPGLFDLIDQLVAMDIRLGVASNSHKTYVESALSILGIKDRFACVFTANDVQNAKPAPEIYLAASDYLQVKPEKCLALEDSPLGMTAALQAGMSCAVVPNPHVDAAGFSDATYIFPSLIELTQALPRLLNGSQPTAGQG
jgi:HAD superfamily hydrolase (TIGR01509 family)